MGIIIFLKAIIAGFLLSLPTGPVNILSIRRTLAKGRIIGLATGLGAAVADSLYAFISGFGLSFVVTTFEREKFILEFGGSIILLLLGIKILFSSPKRKTYSTFAQGGVSAFASGFLLTLANPSIIIAYAALFASFELTNKPNTFTFSLLILLGVMAGAALWWFVLTAVISSYRHRFNSSGIKIINQLSGIIIIGFSLVVWLELLF